MASMNVTLPDPLRDWVQARVDSGRYAAASDYVRDLIRRDQAAADHREALVAALIEGEESGVSPRRVTDILDALRKERHGCLAANSPVLPPPTWTRLAGTRLSNGVLIGPKPTCWPLTAPSRTLPLSPRPGGG